MFDVKDSLCIAGNSAKACEDAIGFGKGYCFVIDGASGLSKVNIVDEQSDAAWFATQVKEKLCARLEDDDRTPTATIISDIIKELNDTYVNALAEKGMEPPSDSPSAGITLFRQMDGRIEFFGLGDCTGVLRKTDGEVIVLKDTRLSILDEQVLRKMAEMHHQTGISVLDAREKCNDLLLLNRSMRNKDGGYWILDLSGDGVEHALICSWPENSVKTFFACSDGFAQLTDVFGIYKDYAELLEEAENTDLIKLCDTLFTAQTQDHEANRFPRFKFRDDTSCLWGKLLL